MERAAGSGAEKESNGGEREGDEINGEESWTTLRLGGSMGEKGWKEMTKQG